MTQKQIILSVLKERGVWVPSWDLQKATTSHGWLGTSADRQARQMAEDGLIERQRKGKYAFYRIKGVKEFGRTDPALATKRAAEKRAEKIKQMEEAGQGKMFEGENG